MVVHWTFWTMRRVSLGNPPALAEVLHTGKCSGILMSFSDAGEALRDVPRAWEWPSPKAAFTQGHRAGLHGAELSADSRSLPGPALRPPTAEYTLMLLRSPFIFPAHVL